MNLTEFQELKEIALSMFNSPDEPRKVRGPGIFIKPNQRIKTICHSITNQIDPALEWSFELFKSTFPTGLHNDANYDASIDSTCIKVMILPIVWDTDKPPSTIVFNERYPTKVFEGVAPNTFLDAVTKKEVPSPLSKEFLLPEDFFKEKLNHCLRTSMNGLTVKSVETWIEGVPMHFDSDLLHSSGTFDGRNGKWKMCILGLGFKKNSEM